LSGSNKVGPGFRSKYDFVGTRSLLNGAPQRDVQCMLGHDDERMTRHYSATIDSEHAAEAHKKFNPVDNMRL